MVYGHLYIPCTCKTPGPLLVLAQQPAKKDGGKKNGGEIDLLARQRQTAARKTVAAGRRF